MLVRHFADLAAVSFSGRVEVKDAMTGAFIAGAIVQLQNAADRVTVKQETTDLGGNAAFMNVTIPAETAVYAVGAPGYRTTTVPAKDRQNVSVVLEPAAAAPGEGEAGDGKIPLVYIIGGSVIILALVGILLFKK